MGLSFKKITENNWSEVGTYARILSFALILMLLIHFSIFLYTSISNYEYKLGDFLENVFVEYHGMVMDIIVFGLIVTYMNSRRSKRLEITRYIEEIDDYREWQEDEAAYRTAGIIRRLGKYKVSNLDLSGCFLKNTNLNGVYLEGANLRETVLIEAELHNADLSRAIFRESYLMKAQLEGANLSGAKLHGASLVNANLRKVKLVGAKCKACFDEADFKGADLSFVDLSNTTNLTAEQLCRARTLYKNKIDQQLLVSCQV